MQNLNLISFEAVKKFRSVRRSIRRGSVSIIGTIYPKRPFNNRKNKKLEIIKRKIYDRIKNR